MSEIYRRRTKIVATLGPATDRDDNLERIIKAGANVLRLNFSHGSPEEHMARANKAREIAKKIGRPIAILGDLQGPKIRLSTFKDGKISLKKGDSFILDANLGRGEGTQLSVGIDYKELPNDVTKGDILLLDDGRVLLEVISTNGVQVETIVTSPGILSDKKGINKLGGGLTAPALTDKDKEDIVTAAKIGVDFLAVSFPRNGADMRYARSLVEKVGFSTKMVAKVERAESVASDEAMDDLINASDVIMVARGDLGVEIGDPQLVAVQKRLIKRSRLQGKVVITATQMMETMINSPMPTRAEVMDVSNAIIDGTDAVMLSAETAAGSFPEETVQKMSEIAVGAESLPYVKTQATLTFNIEIDEEGVAKQAMLLANSLKDIDAMICMTYSGNTALYASRIKSSIPIYAFSRNEKTVAFMNLYRGVYPMHLPDQVDSRTHKGALEVLESLKNKGLLQTGSRVVLTQGDTVGKSTNVIRVLTVK